MGIEIYEKLPRLLRNKPSICLPKNYQIIANGTLLHWIYPKLSPQNPEQFIGLNCHLIKATHFINVIQLLQMELEMLKKNRKKFVLITMIIMIIIGMTIMIGTIAKILVKTTISVADQLG